MGGRGGEHVRYAVPQIDMAVAVEVHAVFDVGRRQKLRLADLARISPDHVTQAKIATLHDLERRKQFALKQFAAAQSCAMVASTRNTGSRPMSPLPKSVSNPQIATMICRGTPKRASTRDSSAA